MHIYYFYSKVKEVSKYVVESLSAYEITMIEKSTDLFDINPKNSILILHIDSYSDDMIELVKYLLKDMQNLKIFALTNSVDFLEATNLLQVGVKGYGNVYMHNVHLHQAVDVIMSGNIWIYPELANHLVKNLKKNENVDNAKLHYLSEHEKECAILVAEGNSNKEIATLLDKQEITIKKHLSSAYKKLGVKNRVELALYLK